MNELNYLILKSILIRAYEGDKYDELEQDIYSVETLCAASKFLCFWVAPKDQEPITGVLTPRLRENILKRNPMVAKI